MRRALLTLAAALALAGCGDRYSAGGLCAQDSDCKLCSPCGCPRAYAKSDVDTASCDDIKNGVTCDSHTLESCPQGVPTALCVSGHCQVVNR